MLRFKRAQKPEVVRTDDAAYDPYGVSDPSHGRPLISHVDTGAAVGLSAWVRRCWTKYGHHALLLVAVSSIANFLYFTTFGIYEDDWAFMVTPYTMLTRYCLSGIWWTMSTFLFGRPLQFLYVEGFALLGAKSGGGLPILYVISAFLYAASVVLLYLALRNRFPAFFALLVALLFALSPLTTIRQLLHAVLTTAPAFICLFLAFILYVRRRSSLSYAVAVLALLTYEPIFPLFIIAPWFKRGRRSWREIFVHCAIVSVILVIYVVCRLRAADARVVGAVSQPALATALSMAKFDIFYVFHSFLSYVYACYVSFSYPPIDALCWTVGLLIPTLLILFSARSTTASRKRTLAAGRRLWWIRNAVLPGAIGLFASYALAYWRLPQVLTYTLTGRDTRVSVGAAFSSSFLIGSLFCLALMAGYGAWWKRLMRSLIGMLLACLFIYSFIIQNDYTNEWAHQRSVLAQILALTPDVTKDTLLVVQHPFVQETLFPSRRRSPSINTQPHGMNWSTSLLFAGAPQALFVYSADWKNYISLKADGRLYFTQENFPGGWGRDTKTSFGRRVISLAEREDGELLRDNSAVMVGGRQINPALANASGGMSNWSRFAPSPFLAQVVPPYVLGTTPPARRIHRPLTTTVTPDSGTGLAQRFVVHVSEGDSYLGGFYLMVHDKIEYKRSCWIYFDVDTETLNLADDAAVSWFGATKVGSGKLSNSQCSISSSEAAFEQTDGGFAVTIPLQFSGGFRGATKLFMYLKMYDDPNSLKGTWEEKGSWLIR
jgi:hypothetical protein